MYIIILAFQSLMKYHSVTTSQAKYNKDLKIVCWPPSQLTPGPEAKSSFAIGQNASLILILDMRQ